jgi:lysyl-tRNA synthetase class 1
MNARKPLIDPALAEAAQTSTAWPFEEARKLVARVSAAGKSEAIFETGYGPSGLPHIGTFGEVARTSMVRHAFRVLTGDTIATRLIAFSDDMDGFRKVPDNLPNQEMLRAHLGKPLTEVPDPFGTHESFAHHNNALLRTFLDGFGFEYEFRSSTIAYRSGAFDATLLMFLERFDDVMAIMLPSLREERAQSYSPFLPIHPKTRVVMQAPVEARDVKAGTIIWRDPHTNERFETPVTGGHAKLQWKPDWAMRWIALGVDYEMAGKDLIDSVKLSGDICRALGTSPPEGFNYELFLDENGQKISKSKGNGLTIDEWLTYGTPESLSLFMHNAPKSAKRLFFDVIPRHVDDYLTHLKRYPEQDARGKLMNPVWHIHAGAPPIEALGGAGPTGNRGAANVDFALLINLVSASNADSPAVLWGFIERYAPGVTAKSHPLIDRLVHYAIRYYRDFVEPSKRFRPPDAEEAATLRKISEALGALPADADAEAIQGVLYDVGRAEPRYRDLKAKGATPEKPGVAQSYFAMIYQTLIGQERGPRFGSFVAIYGIAETRALIARAIAGTIGKAN